MIDEKGCVMRSLFKKFIAIMTLSTIFITSANAVYVYRYQQEQTNWCWAASAQMIGHTMGRNVTQSAIVDYVMGTVANIGSGNIENASKAVNYATLRNTTIRGAALSFAASKAELDSGEPFYISIGWKDKDGGGHAVVAAGYNTSASTLTVVDPAPKCGTKAYSYNSMITGCVFQSGTGKWRNSITI